jgi:hypothetical protein
MFSPTAKLHVSNFSYSLVTATVQKVTKCSLCHRIIWIIQEYYLNNVAYTFKVFADT